MVLTIQPALGRALVCCLFLNDSVVSEWSAEDVRFVLSFSPAINHTGRGLVFCSLWNSPVPFLNKPGYQRFESSHQPWKGLTNHLSATWLLEKRGALYSRSKTFSADTEADHTMNWQRGFKECKVVPLLCKNSLQYLLNSSVNNFFSISFLKWDPMSARLSDNLYFMQTVRHVLKTPSDTLVFPKSFFFLGNPVLQVNLELSLMLGK